ncbi:MAG TPA: RecX family transcriptional regulator [Sphingomicrobium sp.]
MNARKTPRRERPPLDASKLEELAVRYVGRFATSRAKLCAYLARKVRERGWDGAGPPDFDAIAERFCELGYVDDAAYALAKSQSLVSRGYGRRRVDQKLRVDGIGEEDGAAARQLAQSEAVEAALRFAKRRRIGPFGAGHDDPRDREKAVAAMVRAGHPFALARAIVFLPPGAEVDSEGLRDQARFADR